MFYKYLHNLDLQKYLDSVFKGYVSTSPPNFICILSAACVNCNWFFWQIPLLQKIAFNSYLNRNWKWNWKAENIQIFLSEIILAGENGSQGHHFGKIPNSKFVKGLRHSAVMRWCSPHIITSEADSTLYISAKSTGSSFTVHTSSGMCVNQVFRWKLPSSPQTFPLLLQTALNLKKKDEEWCQRIITIF